MERVMVSAATESDCSELWLWSVTMLDITLSNSWGGDGFVFYFFQFFNDCLYCEGEVFGLDHGLYEHEANVVVGYEVHGHRVDYPGRSESVY